MGEATTFIEVLQNTAPLLVLVIGQAAMLFLLAWVFVKFIIPALRMAADDMKLANQQQLTLQQSWEGMFKRNEGLHKKELEEVTSALKAATKKIEGLEATVKGLEYKLAQKTIDLDNAQSELKKLKDDVAQRDTRLTDLETANVRLTKELAEVKADRQAVSNERDQERELRQKLETKVEHLEEEVKKLRTELEKKSQNGKEVKPDDEKKTPADTADTGSKPVDDRSSGL